MQASFAETLSEPPGNQRAFRRFPVSMSVLVQSVTEDGTVRSERQKARHSPMASVVVTDVSLSGLVFIASHPHPPGSLVAIQLCLGARVFSIRAIIKRRQAMSLPGRDAFQCGAQFVRGEGISEFIPAMAKYLQRRS